MRKTAFLTFLGTLSAMVISGATAGLILRPDGLEFPDGTVQTTAATTSKRSFYLSVTGADGSGAKTVCAAGYHMASIFEIFNPSNLRYATELPDAATSDDSGFGPTGGGGWIRTGGQASNTREVGSNCNAWQGGGYGTYASLGYHKVGQDVGFLAVPFYMWDTSPQDCGFARSVWCVED